MSFLYRSCRLVGQLLEKLIALDRPSLTLLESAWIAEQHLASFSIALELPIEPGNGRNAELATMRLTIGASMTDRIVDSYDWHVVDTMEIVHAIGIGNVTLATEQIEHRCVNAKQLILARHRHIGHGNRWIDEEPAVAYHQQCDARISAVVERLQTTA